MLFDGTTDDLLLTKRLTQGRTAIDVGAVESNATDRILMGLSLECKKRKNSE